MSSLRRRRYNDHTARDPISSMATAPRNIPPGKSRHVHNTYISSVRPAVLLLARTCLLPLASAAPLSLWPRSASIIIAGEDEPTAANPSDPNLYVYLGVAVALVLLGGAFAGLTIALMGQDETYLQVIATSGEGSERRHATRVLNLLKKGKHWVLVTLLLSNVITNETLPIVLDRSLGGGWPAVLSSTVLIVIFGEIAPQSVCVRYGLSIGAFCSPFVLVLMWIMAPVAWPTAKLLDWLLGEDHGTMYKKAGLKTLVQLHKTLGPAPGERLMEDEVKIINSVLDLKEKPVGDIMTPMQDVFTMSADTVLDERMMDTILSQGYSRIPIYMPDNSKNFIGMLLVKILITYDPEDATRVRDFTLATLPETAPYTSCLDIINFFQEGKSHMVLVSDFPGQDKGALGVVTLEDVIEELIGEEIIDESDVFIDVHKAIRRLAPAPKHRFNRLSGTDRTIETSDSDHEAKEPTEDEPLLRRDSSSRKPSLTNGGPTTTFLMRRKSSAASDSTRSTVKPSAMQIRSDNAEIRQHLKHLGPSNAAKNPRATKFSNVKIKPGVSTIPEHKAPSLDGDTRPRPQSTDAVAVGPDEANDESTGLVRSAGKDASNGTSALHARYGTLDSAPGSRPGSLPEPMSASEASQFAERNAASPKKAEVANGQNSYLRVPGKLIVGDSEADDSLGELETPSRERSRLRRAARSGSITETTVDFGGMNKLVLETTSSSEMDDAASSKNGGSPVSSDDAERGAADQQKENNGKRHRRKRSKHNKPGPSPGPQD